MVLALLSSVFFIGCSTSHKNSYRRDIYATTPDGRYCEYDGSRYRSQRYQRGFYDSLCESFDEVLERQKCYADRGVAIGAFDDCSYANRLIDGYGHHFHPYRRGQKCRGKTFLGGFGVARFCISQTVRENGFPYIYGSNRGARCNVYRTQSNCTCVPLHRNSWSRRGWGFRGDHSTEQGYCL